MFARKDSFTTEIAHHNFIILTFLQTTIKCMTLMLMWLNFRPFPSIWLNFTLHKALHYFVNSHIQRNLLHFNSFLLPIAISNLSIASTWNTDINFSKWPRSLSKLRRIYSLLFFSRKSDSKIRRTPYSSIMYFCRVLDSRVRVVCSFTVRKEIKCSGESEILTARICSWYYTN